MGDRLGPALLGISDGQGSHISAEGQIRVFQPFPRRLRIIGFVQDPQVRAHRRKLFGVLLQHAHAHAASHHQQIEQIVIGGKTVDHGKGAVIVRHRVLIRHRRSSHPQGTSGQELAQVINIVIQLLRFLSGRGRQGAVVFHRPPHGLPPEFPASEPGQEPGIGARIHKRAELLHGTRRMLVGAQKFTGQKSFLLHAAGPFLLLLQAIPDIGLRRLIILLLKQRLLHRILDRLDIPDLLLPRAQLLRHCRRDPFDPFLAVLSCRCRREGNRPRNESGVKGNHLSAPFPYVHHFLMPPFS